MATLLGLTNPVPGHDNIINSRPVTNSPANAAANNNPNIQNIVDPSRVGQADRRTEQQDAGAEAEVAKFRYGSNFQTFLQRLQTTPDLVEQLSRIFSGKYATVVSSGLQEGVAVELSSVMEMLRMDEAGLSHFIQGQYRSLTRFGGALFALLRNAYAAAPSEGQRQDILQFLKHYSDFSSTGHVETGIMRNLATMKETMPASWGERLAEMTRLLEGCIDNGDRTSALKLLQGQILPFLSNYVSRTHDMGQTRMLLTLLTLDIARYESGSEEALTDSFHQLRGYSGLKDKLGGIDDGALKWLLENTDFKRASDANVFADKLVSAAEKALDGKGGAETQETFREIVSAMLTNESVYMPLNHLILPLQWGERMVFSEMWIDPDDQSESGGSNDAERVQRFLLKMDIQGLGLFDVAFASRGTYVELQVFCPEKLAEFTKIFKEALTNILKNNGFTPGEVKVDQMVRPLTISQVFPKIFEGKNSINVKV